MPRRGPLHTCGISMIEILGKASTKTKDFNGPIGSMTKRVFILVTTLFPFIYALQDQLLAILSYADDHILAVESAVEAFFPPSSRLFNKIDKLVYFAETLPGKFDDAMNKFPVIIHQVPFLDWVLAHVISWLNFLIITLTHWGSDNMKEKEKEKEKEIRVVISCDNPNKQTVPSKKPDCPSETTNIPQNKNAQSSSINVPDSSQDETKEVFVESSSNTECMKIENSFSQPVSSEDEGDETEKRSKNVNLNSKMPVKRRSYKEILETGTKESGVKKDNSVPKPIPPKATTGSEKKYAKDDSVTKNIPPKATDGSEKIYAKDDYVPKNIPPKATNWGEKKDEKEDEDRSEDRILELFDAGWHLSPSRR